MAAGENDTKYITDEKVTQVHKQALIFKLNSEESTQNKCTYNRDEDDVYRYHGYCP